MGVVYPAQLPVAVQVGAGDEPLDEGHFVDDEEQAHALEDHHLLGLGQRGTRCHRGGLDLAEVGHDLECRRGQGDRVVVPGRGLGQRDTGIQPEGGQGSIAVHGNSWFKAGRPRYTRGGASAKTIGAARAGRAAAAVQPGASAAAAGPLPTIVHTLQTLAVHAARSLCLQGL
ncbi:hypothetical protein RA210_U20220 [Rubrivivax sp. A210]|nr:hypothetical protein RA210_U20220 [Rubrivivax sp. A210]